jgi:hypothetical protein
MQGSLGRNPAADLFALYAGAAVAVTAGGASDNTEALTPAIDLLALPDRFEAVAFTGSVTTTLAAGKSLTVTGKFITSDDDVTYSDMTSAAAVLTLSSTAGGTVTGAFVTDCSLEYAKRYVKFSITPDLSAANTDTANIQRSLQFSGRRKQS